MRGWIGTVVVALCGVMVLAACEPSKISQTPKRIGVLLGVEVFSPVVDSFADEMRRQGFVDGKTVVYDVRRAKSDMSIVAELARDLVATKPDILLTVTNKAALEAKKAAAGTGIPVFFTIVLSPLESGVVDSMIEPSGNITGIRNPVDEFVGKRLEFLARMMPQAKRVWVPFNPQYPTTKSILPKLEATAEALGLTLVKDTISSADDVIRKAQAYQAPPFDAVLIMPNAAPQNPDAFAAILNLAEKHALPVIANTARQVESGALLSYHVDSRDTGRLAAKMIALMLAEGGEKPRPVINSEPQLALNAEVARRLGIAIPEDLRILANTIY